MRWPLLAFLAFLFLCDIASAEVVPRLLAELRTNPSIAINKRDFYYKIVEESHKNDPDGYQLLGLVEYIGGNVQASYRQYLKCAELADFSESYSYCILNCALLFSKREHKEFNDFLSSFFDINNVLRRAPQFYVNWVTFAELFAKWYSMKQNQSGYEQLAVVDKISNTLIKFGVTLYPDCPELLIVQGVLRFIGGNYCSASDCFAKSMRARESVSMLLADQRDTFIRKLDNIVFESENYEECLHYYNVPNVYLSVVNDAVVDITNPASGQTYALSMLRLAKLIDESPRELELWNTFADIHVKLLMISDELTLIPMNLKAIFLGILFYRYQRLGISLFPRHPQLLFLQGVEYYLRGEYNCAFRVLFHARRVSAYFCDIGCPNHLRPPHIIEVFIEMAKIVADTTARINHAGHNKSLDLNCFPLVKFSSCPDDVNRNTPFDLSGMRVDADGVAAQSIGSLSCLDNTKQVFINIIDTESIIEAVNKCTKSNQNHVPINISNFVDDVSLLSHVVDKDEYTTARLRLNNPLCRVLQIGCAQLYCASPGWTVADAAESITTHVVADISNLPAAFHENSLHILYASHVFEHIPKRNATSVLIQWHSLLTQGGLLLLAVPDLLAIANMLVRHDVVFEEKIVLTEILYGGQEDQYNIHHTGYFFEALETLLYKSGFCNVRRVNSFGLFNDFSDFGLKGHNSTLSLNVAAIAC